MYNLHHYWFTYWLVTQSQWNQNLNQCSQWLKPSPLGQNGHHFADHIFRCIFMNEKFCILIKVSLKFVPKGSIENNPALAKIMTRHRIGDKPLSEPMLTFFTDAYMWQRGRWVNILRPRQNGHHFSDDIFNCIFLNENVGMNSIKISLKFVP